jgi:hypothetical protein
VLGAARPEDEGRDGGPADQAFLKKRHPDVRIEASPAAPAYKGDHERSIRRGGEALDPFAFGKTPVFVREGGTIGAVLSMEQILKCPIVFMGLSLPHTATTRQRELRLGPGGGGIAAFAKFFEEVSKL